MHRAESVWVTLDWQASVMKGREKAGCWPESAGWLSTSTWSWMAVEFLVSKQEETPLGKHSQTARLKSA